MAKNGFLPRALMRVHPKSGIPRVALLTNFAVGILFLLPLPSWHAIVSTLGGVFVFTLAIASVSLYAFRMTNFGDATRRLRGMQVIAPAAFVVSSLVVFWAGWTNLWPTIPIIGVALAWWTIATFVIQRRNDAASRGGAMLKSDVKAGIWLVVYIAFMYLISMLASTGGIGAINDLWGLVIVIVGSFSFYVWGVRSGATYMRERGYVNTDDPT